MLIVNNQMTRRQSLLCAGIATLFILLVRIWLLARYSSSVPSWDAWGAEATPLYGDWINGTFTWSNLWAWHNEHRIFFTRVLDLGLFLANQMQWDVRVQTLASSTLCSLVAGGSMWWILRHVDAPLSLGLCGVVLLSAIFPNGWANTYQGFQSCFYFVILFALLSIRNAGLGPASFRGGFQTALFALGAVFSLAAGVLAAVAAATIVLGRAWVARIGTLRTIGFAAAPVAVAIWALLDARKGEIHPTSIVEFFHSLAIMMSWPYSNLLGLLFWIPPVIFAVHVLRTRSATAVDLVFAGLAMWVLAIDLAAAWTRAYNFVDVQSRYTDLLIPALISQIYFAFRVADLYAGRGRRAAVAKFAATIIGGVLCYGLATASVGEFEKWKGYDFYTRIGASYVRAYLEGDSSALDGHPYGYIPYPVAETLKLFLAAPAVRSFLPLSISPSIPLGEQRQRSCVWSPTNNSQLPIAGRVSCSIGEPADPGRNSRYVGPLSSITYAFWALIGRQSYPAFVSEGTHSDLPAARAECAVDQLNGSPIKVESHAAPFADVLSFAGWIGPNDVHVSSPPIKFVLEGAANDRYVAATYAGIPRPEVAHGAGVPGYEYSGFHVYLDGSKLPAGSYRLKIATASGAECDSGIDVTIDHDADVRLAY